MQTTIMLPPQRSGTRETLVTPLLSPFDRDPRTLSTNELVSLLNDHNRKLKALEDKDQHRKSPILLDTLSVLIRVQKPKLLSLSQNEFFTSLRNPFIDILHQWSRSSTLTESQVRLLHHSTKLIRRLIETVDDITQLPLWLSDQTLLQTIGDCLHTLGTSHRLPEGEEKYPFKYFTRLIDAYILFQQQLDSNSQDKLLPLFDPLVRCLTSRHYIRLFTDLYPDQSSMSAFEKFFLIQCPTLLLLYNGKTLSTRLFFQHLLSSLGSQREELMHKLLSTMLSKYVTLLEHHLPSVQQWRRPMMRCVVHLIQMINHGSHEYSSLLDVADQLLKLAETPSLQKNIRANASNVETELLDVTIAALVKMVNNPSVLAHVKQAHATNQLLPLTTCEYEPLALNAYSLLAQTMNEEDIRAMPNAGRLLSVITDSLKKTVTRTPDSKASVEQLLEILKGKYSRSRRSAVMVYFEGLLQHDQLKEEVMKQNLLPFLLDCTNTLGDKRLKQVFETLWSLTFREEAASALRSNDEFLERIQRISQENNDEGLKKATDGLVWKLIQGLRFVGSVLPHRSSQHLSLVEPACLEKVARQEGTNRPTDTLNTDTVIELVVNEQGQQQVMTKTRPVTDDETTEREFEYDIMISYCHADKELTYKIHKFLVAQGFKIWIDLDNMYGPGKSKTQSNSQTTVSV